MVQSFWKPEVNEPCSSLINLLTGSVVKGFVFWSALNIDLQAASGKLEQQEHILNAQYCQCKCPTVQSYTSYK